MKIKKRITITAVILVDEDFDTNLICICEDIADPMNLNCPEIYTGQSENFQVLDYISQDTIELEENPELCGECGKSVALGSGRCVNRVTHLDDGFTCAECDEKLRGN